RRSRRRTRRSCASGASESSIDWFWQTMQRSSADSARARASSAGSDSLSPGSRAEAAPVRLKQKTSRSSARRTGLPRLLGRLRRDPARRAWRADAQTAVAQRDEAAERHDDRAEPDQRDERLPVDAHRRLAIGGKIAERDVEL